MTAPTSSHVMLKEHENIDWRRLLTYMEQYWEVLLVHILNFRFVYPTERHRIPQWLMDELMERLRLQDGLPVPQTRDLPRAHVLAQRLPDRRAGMGLCRHRRGRR